MNLCILKNKTTSKMKKIIIIATAIFTVTAATAKVNLPQMFSDGMVMQQQTAANIWGTATKQHTVKITTSWDNKTYTVNSDKEGKWTAGIQTPAAGGPYSITLSDGEKTILDNILIGEVWICSGQSNMEMPMKGYKNQPVENGVSDILHSADKSLRLFTVKRNAQLNPVDDVTGEWSEATPESVREFSATAYYFGRELRRALQCPVGLIVTSWGGAACEAWMAADWLKAFPKAQLPKSDDDVKKTKQRCPTALYNGMLRPLIGYTMRGAVWYQGEDNIPRYETYADMQTAMVEGWRKEWKQGDFPFYYCQIAPYDYTLIGWTYNSALLREQQMMAEQKLANTGMACLMDAGLEFGIHPRKKAVAGERLALLALDGTYGIKGLSAKSAYYKSTEFKGDTAIVSFNRADMWIYGTNGLKSDLVEVAGDDHVFHPAKAWIERSKLYAKSDSVKHPVAVRYAFRNWAVGDLYSDGLPISSFRSDNWNDDNNGQTGEEYDVH